MGAQKWLGGKLEMLPHKEKKNNIRQKKYPKTCLQKYCKKHCFYCFFFIHFLLIITF